MCCQKLSDFLKLNTCCCGIPLKMATYIAGGLMLMYCSFMEIDAFQSIYIHDTRYNDHNDDYEDPDMTPRSYEPGLVVGSGTGVINQVMRSQDGFQTTRDYVHNFVRGLLIAWIVINGLLIISTCIMLYGNAKGKSMLLLQWLVVIVTIGIGNLADVIIAIIYVEKSRHYIPHAFKPEVWFLLLLIQCVVETGAIFFAFVVVRSYYYRLTLPSIPVSFNALKSQEHLDTSEEDEDTSIKHSIVDV